MVKATKNIFFTHILGWLIFLSLPAIFIFSLQANTATLYVAKNLFNWSLFFIFIIIFYFHTYWLFPRYLVKKKYAAYIAFVVSLLIIVMLVKPFDKLAVNGDNHFPGRLPPNVTGRSPSPHYEQGLLNTRETPGRRNKPVLDIVSLTLFILIIALSLTLSFERIRQMAVAKAATAEAEKTVAELALLKAQINPHFLFNTLNNIYTLALMQDENTAGSILKFANIMRYVTDETPGHFVPLKDEINCMNDYIDLQQLRLTTATTVSFKCEGDLENKLIAPLILITFLENAFKYGVSNNTPSEIKVFLKAAENNIEFVCENTVFPKNTVGTKGGVGMLNTSKRLDHLYAGKHDLRISQTNNLYTLYLKIYQA